MLKQDIFSSFKKKKKIEASQAKSIVLKTLDILALTIINKNV